MTPNAPDAVNLFITCLLDTFFPEIGEAVVITLNRAGQRVNLPSGQTCCGQPAYNSGLHEEAREAARQTILSLEKTSSPVVVPSGSCAAMIIHHYPELFEEEPEWQQRARKLAARTFELSQYLVDVLGITQLGAVYPGKITYHPSCHLLREMNIRTQPQTLLENVGKAEILPLPNPETCCGFGGIFSVEHPELSGEMLQRKLNHIEQSGAPVIVVCDAGCLANIQGGLHHQGLPQRVVHLAEILASPSPRTKQP